MIEKLKEILKSVGTDKLLLALVLILCGAVLIIAQTMGKEVDSPIVKISEEIIEDIVEAETGIKIEVSPVSNSK